MALPVVLAAFLLLASTSAATSSVVIRSRQRQPSFSVTATVIPSVPMDRAISPPRAIGQYWLMNVGQGELVSNSYRFRCEDVVVAVVDTGLDYSHKGIRRLWRNKGETGRWAPPAKLAKQGVSCRDKSCNGIDDDGNGFVDDVVGWDFVHDVPQPYDTHGHGTHVSGIIAASTEPEHDADVQGICPGARIMALHYYDNDGMGSSNLANTVRAFRYASRMGADVVNYSGGGPDPSGAEKMALEAMGERGILLVAAAGNDGRDLRQTPYFPASYGLGNIVSVASIDGKGKLLTSSNFGDVDVAAPGLMILSTLPEDRYGTMSGSSQATAVVSGIAAALAGEMKARGLKPDAARIKSWICRSAVPMPKGTVRYGRASLKRAVDLQAKELGHR